MNTGTKSGVSQLVEAAAALSKQFDGSKGTSRAIRTAVLEATPPTAQPRSVTDDEDNKGNSRNHASSVQQRFPQRLLQILSDSSVSDSITWLPHGRSFVITRPDIFSEWVIPLYFSPNGCRASTKYPSFTRKLNRWGFHQVTGGPDTGAFHHPLFRRDQPQLCLGMVCEKSRKRPLAIAAEKKNKTTKALSTMAKSTPLDMVVYLKSGKRPSAIGEGKKNKTTTKFRSKRTMVSAAVNNNTTKALSTTTKPTPLGMVVCQESGKRPSAIAEGKKNKTTTKGHSSVTKPTTDAPQDARQQQAPLSNKQHVTLPTSGRPHLLRKAISCVSADARSISSARTSPSPQQFQTSAKLAPLSPGVPADPLLVAAALRAQKRSEKLAVAKLLLYEAYQNALKQGLNK